MNFIDYNFSLDIHAAYAQTSLTVMKKDSKRRLCINLVEKGRPYEISEECYAVFAAKKPDGKFIFNNCVIENNKIFYELTEQTTIAVGEMPCEIKLYGADDALISSPRFKIIVNKPVFDDEDENEVESSDEVTALTALISQTADLIHEVETKLENGEFDGHDMTHEWEGTVLKVTSASGTSEADLQGPQGIQGIQGVQGIQGIQGVGVEKVEQIVASTEDEGTNVVKVTLTNGNSFTFDIKNGSKGSKGDRGPQGIQGIQGIQGPQGETGRGLTILGYYATVAALTSAKPNPKVGDTYGIGSTAPYNIYMWDGSEWVDNGQLQGARGPEGPQGIQGIQGVPGEKGADGEKGDKGDPGTNGTNGVSCTHSWNGTTLTVTSASGSSSANLKGDKGDKGDKGEPGATGPAGYTPVKGTDYYTDADKTEMVNAVLAALPNGDEVSY